MRRAKVSPRPFGMSPELLAYQPEYCATDASQVSVHLADVKNVLRAYSIEVSASTLGDLKEVS